MKTSIIIFVTIFTFLIAGQAFSDLLPKGKKRVAFYFKIDNASEFPDYVIIAYPINISNGVPMAKYEIIDSAKSIYTSCKYFSPAIYAIEEKDFNEEEFENIVAQQNKELDYLKELGDYLKQNFIKLTTTYYTNLIDKDSPVKKITAVYTLGITDGSLSVIKTQIVCENIDGSTTINDDAETGSVLEESNKFSLWYIALSFVSFGAILSIIIIKRKKS